MWGGVGGGGRSQGRKLEVLPGATCPPPRAAPPPATSRGRVVWREGVWTGAGPRTLGAGGGPVDWTERADEGRAAGQRPGAPGARREARPRRRRPSTTAPD